MKTFKNSLHNTGGYALVYTLMVLILVTILGVSLLTISANSMKITDKERQSQSTFYIAEGGLTYIKYDINNIIQNTYKDISSSITSKSTEDQLVLNYFNKIKSEINTLNGTIYNRFEKQNNQTPEALITIEQHSDNPLTYKLTSKGYLPDSATSKTVSQLLTIPTPTFSTGSSGSSGNVPIGGTHAIIFKTEANISSGIVGDISTVSGDLNVNWGFSVNGNINVNPEKIKLLNNFNLDENKIKNSLESFDFEQMVPPFPNDMFSNSSVYTQLNNIYLSGGNNGSLKLEGNSYIHNITILHDKKLDIYVGDTDKNLIVDELDIEQGSINLIGSGKLNLYVKDLLVINGSFNKDGNPNLSNIYYNGNAPLSFTGGTVIGSSLFAKTSIKFENIGGGIKGNIVTTGEDVIFRGGATSNAQCIIAPNAHVWIESGAHIKGTVIADSVTVSGGSSVTYGESIIQSKPSGGSQPDAQPDSQPQLPSIIEQPMVEVDTP